MKKLIVFTLCISGFFQSTFAQVPSYVPKSGLVGWWPFNGNANDESGNGNNGTVNGATLAADRLGNTNRAYSFDGNDYISCSKSGVTGSNSRTVSFWIKSNSTTPSSIFSYGTVDGNPFQDFRCVLNSTCNGIAITITKSGKDVSYSANNTWDNFVFVFDNSVGTNTSAVSIYKNSILQTSFCYSDNSGTINTSGNLPIFFGRYHWLQYTGNNQYFVGLIDDIGHWNRALTPTEIEQLYKACNADEIIANPTDSKQKSAQNATFAVTSVSGSTIQWQSNADNLGWMNVPSNSFYSGGNSVSLTVNNVQISNHNQKFRAIASNGPCKDTSAEAKIIITDTCINTKSISVADTLKFAINLTGVAPPNNRNAMKVYPNPTNSAVVIDNGNYTAMANYTLKIENIIGQRVFLSKVAQQQFTVDVSTLGGKGVYTLTVLDSAGKLLETKKIVLQ